MELFPLIDMASVCTYTGGETVVDWPTSSGKVAATLGARLFSDGFPHQIWALRVTSLLVSGHSAFKSTLLCAFCHFCILPATSGTLKVIGVFPDASFVYPGIWPISRIRWGTSESAR